MSLLEFDLCHSCWPYDLFSFRHWREDRIVGTFFTLIYMCTYRVINLFKDNNCSCNTEKLFHLLVYLFILLHVPPLTSYIGNSKEPSFLAPLYPLCHPLFIAENHKVYFSSRLWGAKQIIFQDWSEQCIGVVFDLWRLQVTKKSSINLSWSEELHVKAKNPLAEQTST